jgi:hypothetical protein
VGSYEDGGSPAPAGLHSSGPQGVPWGIGAGCHHVRVVRDGVQLVKETPLFGGANQKGVSESATVARRHGVSVATFWGAQTALRVYTCGFGHTCNALRGKGGNMFIWFIPNTVLVERLAFRPGATLAHICAEAGAVDAVYMREQKPFAVRLEAPKMDAGSIHELWGNKFASCCPVWTTEDEVRPLPPGMGF